jgi:hypothetical protein
VVCDEHGIGGGGVYCGDNDAQLGRINLIYREASDGKRAYTISRACSLCLYFNGRMALILISILYVYSAGLCPYYMLYHTPI